MVESKKRVKKEMDKSSLVTNHSIAMRELAEKSDLRDRLNSSIIMERRTASVEAARTLDSIEARVLTVNEKAKQHRIKVAQRVSTVHERVRSQGAQFRERQA